MDQVKNGTASTWLLKAVLENLNSETATPHNTFQVLNNFKCSGGGVSVVGTVFFFARNFDETSQGPPAFVFEGDKYQSYLRTPNEVAPFCDCILATNHNLILGADYNNPNVNFNKTLAWNTLWRYQVGEATLSSWTRTNTIANASATITILKELDYGVTEYSVVWDPKRSSIWVARDDMSPSLWDAPYFQWEMFTYDELFSVVNANN